MTKRNTINASDVIDNVLSKLAGQSSVRRFLLDNRDEYEQYAQDRIEELTSIEIVDENAPRVYPKPYIIDAPLGDYSDACLVLAGMVAVLVDEGPDLLQAAKECNIQEKKKRGRPPKPKTTELTVVNPKVRANPFYPQDQSPLTLYAARVISATIPVQPYEHLAAARLLLPHTVKGNRRPDFDRDQLMRVIRLIEAECTRLGIDFIKTPADRTEPFPLDYSIALPETGSVRFVGVRENEGALQWEWKEESEDASSIFLYSPKLEVFEQFFAKLQDNLRAEGLYSYEIADRRGIYLRIGLQVEPSGANTIVKTLAQAGQPQAADMLDNMAKLWLVGSGGSFGYQGIGKGEYGLNQVEMKELKKYVALHGTESANKLVRRASYGFANERETNLLYAMYQLVRKADSDLIDIQAHLFSDNPKDIAYIESQNKPGVLSFMLPPQVLPFRVRSGPRGASQAQFFLGYGEGTQGVGYFYRIPRVRTPEEGLNTDKAKEGAGWIFCRQGVYGETRQYFTYDSDKGESGNPIIKNFESGIRSWYQVSSYFYHELFLAPALLAYNMVESEAIPETKRKTTERMPERVIRGITQAIPGPGGVLMGAGRIDPIVVTSKVSGVSVTAPGLDPEIYKQIKHLIPSDNFKAIKEVAAESKVGTGVVKKKVTMRPLPYQKIGIAFIHAAGGRAIIADEMGLGKTIQALGALQMDPSPVTGQRMFPALIICPGSVLINWQNEVKSWLPHVTVSAWESDLPNNCDVTVITWGKAALHWDKLLGSYQTVIIDEAHYGKRIYKKAKVDARPSLNMILRGQLAPVPRAKPGSTAADPDALIPKEVEGEDENAPKKKKKAKSGSSAGSPFTARSLGALILAQSSPHAILLSGTLLENAQNDIPNAWSFLSAVDPVAFPDARPFKKILQTKDSDAGEDEEEEVGPGEETKFIKKKKEYAPEVFIRLRDLFARYMLRRMKNTVAEQINLGCLYAEEYATSDEGCAGAGQEIVIDADGKESEPSEPIIQIPYNNNPNRKYQKTKRNCGCGGSARRNIGTRVSGGSVMPGYLRVGTTKEIVYLEVKPTPEQINLIRTTNEGMGDVIIKAERQRRIKSIVAKAINERVSNLRTIERWIEEQNEAFSDKDPESILGVMLATDYYLRSTAGRIKIQQTIDLMYDILVNKKEPLLIWAEQKVVIQMIQNVLEGKATTYDDEGNQVTVEMQPFKVNGKPIRFGVITGETPNSERAETVRRFQSGEIDLIVCSKAMREGVTLTRAKYAIFTEFWWVPAWLMQAEDRIYRIGQKRDCTITYLVLPPQDTEQVGGGAFRVDQMDSRMMGLLRTKRAVTNAILGGEEFQTVTEEEDPEATENIRGEEAETTKVIQENFEGAADEILSVSGKSMEITIEDVKEELVRLKLKDIKYRLTKAGLNPELTKVTYTLTGDANALREKVAKSAGVTHELDVGLRLLGKRGGSATREDLLKAVDNNDVSFLNRVIRALTKDYAKFNLVKVQRGEGAGRLSDLAILTLTRMQELYAEGISEFTENGLYSAVEPLTGANQADRASKSVFLEKGIGPLVEKKLAIRTETERIYSNNGDAYRRSFPPHLDTLLRNITPAADKQAILSSMRYLTANLKAATQSKEQQDAIDAYADLAEYVDRAKQSRIPLPEQTVKAMQAAYAFLSR